MQSTLATPFEMGIKPEDPITLSTEYSVTVLENKMRQNREKKYLNFSPQVWMACIILEPQMMLFMFEIVSLVSPQVSQLYPFYNLASN